MKTIVLTGGGTGGHVYPCLALLPELKKADYQIIYVGGEGDTLEKRAAEAVGLTYYGLPTIKLVRSFSPASIINNLKIPVTLFRCEKKAVELVKLIKPDVVFSKGGYASLPFTLAAIKLKLPVVCHESDLTLGIANKLASMRGAKLLTANPHSTAGEFVGMPLRRELFSENRSTARKKYGVPDGKKVLLIVGGSGGAKTLNELLKKHFAALTKLFFVIHIYGKNGAFTPPNALKDGYLSLPYSDDMSSLYAAADLVLSRAGATAVAEISALNKKCLFIPLPKGISRGDQLFNARLATEYGGNVLIEDDKLDSSFLPALINALNSPPMRSMTADSNGKIVGIINDSIGRGDLCKNKKR